MRRGETLAGLLALLLLSVPGASAQEGESNARQPAGAAVKGADLELLRAVRAIATRVEQLRREPFERPPIAVRAPDAMREVVADIRALNVITRERMEARSRAWIDVGLGGNATPEALYRFLASDLSGIGFDPSGNRLLVSPDRLSDWDFSTDATDDTATRVLLATGIRADEPLVGHLLMHVRQRERIGGDWLAETTDATLAGAAWAEGEANLVALRYLFSGMGLADEVVTPRLDPADALDGLLVPAGLVSVEGTLGVLLNFVYREGYAIAAETHQAGGWKAVGEALATGAATRDLMHRDQRGTAPLSIEPEPAPGQGWSLADSDTLGEQAIFVLLATATGKDNLGLMAGDGWLGDRLDRWEGVSDAGITVWRSRWRTAEDAGDFVYAYRRGVEARFPAGVWLEGESPRFDTGSRILEMQQDGTAVRIVWAPGAGAAPVPGAGS